MTLHYDEAATIRELERLPLQLRVAFALLTATRILPAYGRFHARTGRGDPVALQELVERLWRDLDGEVMTHAEVQASVDRAMELVPSEDDGWDEESQPYAEDAAAAVAYSLRARLTNDPQEGAWAARRVYEASDHFALAGMEHPPDEYPDEEVTIAQPCIQAELARQKRDLGELGRLMKADVKDWDLPALRERSEREAESFFINPT